MSKHKTSKTARSELATPASSEASANKESQESSPQENSPRENSSGRFSYEGLDRVIHEKARLGILTSLSQHADGLLFSELKELCALTDGNLSRHIQTLQEAGLVAVWKGFRNKRPQTLCRLTDDGRKRFQAYIDELERVLADAAAAKAAGSARSASPGWSSA